MSSAPNPSPITDVLMVEAYDYWRRIKGMRSVPRRADLDPAAIKRVLPHVILVDVLGAGRYRYRLIGTECVVAHGVNATGLTLDKVLKDPAYRSHVIGLYDQCVANRRAVYSESVFSHDLGTVVERHVKVLFMPLSNDGIAVNMVFVVQMFGFANEEVRNQHFTAVRPHKEIVHAEL